MGQRDVLHARTRQSILSTTKRNTNRRGQSRFARFNTLASEHFDNVFEVSVPIAACKITEIQDDGDGVLTVTVHGETFELTEEAFTALTGRDWQECV